MVHKDGSTRWIEAHGKVLRDSKGNAVRFVGTDTDITERRRFEEALWESEERFHSVISNTPVVLWAIDSDGMFTLSEGKGLEVLGFKPREIVGQSAFEMFRDNPEIIEDIHKALSGQEINSIYQIGDLTYETKLQPIRDKERTTTGVSGVSIDVTERLLAEKLIKEQVQKLSELNKLKTDLLRRSSHELKTPLISIKGYADLLLTLHADKLDDEMFSIVEEIKRGSLRLEDLVKNLLESSQLESGKMQIKVAKDDLAFLISFCVGELRLLANKRNHKIFLNIHDKLITLFEKEKIYDVVNNILSNAIKYTPPGGIIEVKSKIKDGFYIISVKDNGIGIEKDEKAILFQQFGKIERFGQGWDIEAGGSGLGLYISKKLIELHGGNIWLESEGKNKGSTFYFSLPINN
jgi:PAS domain S-box-containing protein